MQLYRNLRRKAVSYLNGQLMPRLGVKLMRSRPKSFAFERQSQQKGVTVLTVKRDGGSPFPVRLREGTSDWMTFDQVFIDEDYDLRALPRHEELADLYKSYCARGTPLIVDLGANIGLSALYLSEIWPEAQIVAVEPDASNYEQLLINAGDRSRIHPIRAGIASESSKLRIVDPVAGKNAFRTEVASEESDAVEGLPVTEILDRFPESEGFIPFIIKIDIEGAEGELFSRNTAWLDRFPLAVVELHDWLFPKQQTARPFLKVVADLNRDFVYADENVFSIKNDIESL